MAQGLGIGMTDYSNQSLEDIKEDIIKWIRFIDDSLTKVQILEKQINTPSVKGKISINFFSEIYRFYKTCKTFNNDFNEVLTALNKNKLYMKHIKLLYHISSVADDDLLRLSTMFNNDTGWHEYGASWYKTVEDIYCEMGDLLGTLIDSGNAAKRLKDYMGSTNKMQIVNKGVIISGIGNSVENRVNIGSIDNRIDNSTNIGNGNKIKNSNIGSFTIESEKSKKESWWKKSWKYVIIPLAVAIVAGIVVAIIVHEMGI